MSQTKGEFNLSRIIELIDEVILRESIAKKSQSYADLGFVKLYAKDLVSKCEGCKDTPSGSKNEKTK